MQLPPAQRAAAVRAASFDPDSHTIEIVWTTGAAVRRCDWWDGTEYDEVLSLAPGAVRMDRLNAGAPFVDTHSTYCLDDVIGSVVPGSARIEDGVGVATIQLSKAAGVADTVQKIAEGVIRNISVGYWQHKVIKTEATDGTVARWDVTDWEPLEISAVPVPADAGAQVRSEQSQGEGPKTRGCLIVTQQAAPAPTPRTPDKESPMATRAPKKPASPKSDADELKRQAEILTGKRAADDEDDKDEREAEDDEDKKDECDDDADGEMAADDADEKNECDDDKDERADDSDDEDDKDERAAPKGKRAAGLSAADVKRAAEEAVRADRARGAAIRKEAARFGLPKFGERHVERGTSLAKFRLALLERLAERQAKTGTPIAAAAAEPGIDTPTRAGTPNARDYERGAAEARALLRK